MEAVNKTEKLERLSQKEIIRFYSTLMKEQSLNPKKFNTPLFILSVSVNDEELMTRVQIVLVNVSGEKYKYEDYHAQDYSCSNISLSPIKD